MLNFLKTPKGLIIAGIIVLAIVLLISYNWATIKGWFMKSPGRQVNPCEDVVCDPGKAPYITALGTCQCRDYAPDRQVNPCEDVICDPGKAPYITDLGTCQCRDLSRKSY